MSLTTPSSIPGGASIGLRVSQSGVAGLTDGSGASASRPLANARAGTVTTAAELCAPEPTRPAVLALVPAGTDPDLWRALTSAERAFFAHTPLSESPVYERRPGESPAAGAPAQLRRGIHLDMRA